MKLINTLIVLLLNLEIVFGEGKFIRTMRAYLSSAVFFCLFFFQDQLFRKVLSEIPSECQIVWNQIRPDKMSGLILFQTVCMKFYLSSFSLEKSKYHVAMNNECHYVSRVL